MIGRVRRHLIENDRHLALLTAILFFAALNLQLFPLHLFALVPAMEAMRRAGSVRVAGRRALLAMALCCYASAWWLLTLVKYSLLAPAIYILGPGYYTLWLSAPLIAAEWVRRRTGWAMVAILPPLLVLQDFLIGLGEMRFTVTQAAHMLSYWPSLIQYLDWTGPLGATAWIAASNALLFDAWRARSGQGEAAGRPRRLPAGLGRALIVAGLAGLVALHGAWRMRSVAARFAAAPASCDTVAIQPDLELFIKHDSDEIESNRRVILDLAREGGAGADLVVLPEAAMPGVVHHRPEETPMPRAGAYAALARREGFHFLGGTMYARSGGPGESDLYNAALLISPEAGVVDWNAKSYLLPFIEAIPFFNRFGITEINIGWGGFFDLLGGFTPGDPGRPLVFDGAGAPLGRLGVLFCSEEFYPDLTRALAGNGAELLACISEDTWYAASPQFARYLSRLVVPRCIETRRACVRAANTGISGFVTPDGRFHDETRQWQRVAIRRRLPLSGEKTFYVRHGDWPALIAFLWAAGLAGAGIAGAGVVLQSGPSGGASRTGRDLGRR